MNNVKSKPQAIKCEILNNLILSMDQWGKAEKGPYRPNDRPHCIMIMVTLMKDSLNSRRTFENKAWLHINVVTAHLNFKFYNCP